MPFTLTTTPAFFQDLMNYTLKDHLDTGVIVYIDDMLISAKNKNIYDELVKAVLERLVKKDLVISPEKCV
jgi:hypothetical protein